MSAKTGTVGATAVVINMDNEPWPLSITVIPGSGNTSKCEFSTTPQASASPGTANWQPWSAGTAGVVSAITTVFLAGKVTALRFSRVTGTSNDTYEIVT